MEYGLTDIQEYYANTGALKRAAQVGQAKLYTPSGSKLHSCGWGVGGHGPGSLPLWSASSYPGPAPSAPCAPCGPACGFPAV